MVEILHNNYQIPVYSVEDQENIINLIHSKEFNDIYSFYSEQIPRGSRLEQLPDFEKRMGFYLYYTGQEQFLNQLDVLLYKKHMPTIQEFLKDDAYMGNSYAIIYPYWRQILAKIFDPSNQYFECVFRGSIGSGKSTIARRGLIYALYRICCLRSPHKLFNIAPDTVLSALMISVTLQQAQDTALKPVLEMIRNSPCFHEVRKMTAFDSFGPNDPVPFCRQGNGIRFPNNVYLSVGSNINHIIGYSVFGSIFDEAEEKDSSEAFKLYTGLRERIRSRFLNSSLIYCALISSSKSKSGMVWEYIHKIKPDDPETLLLDPAIWEVKGDALGLSGKHFWIYIGTKTHPSKVLPEEYNDVPLDKLNYVPPAGCELLEVPIEYKREFENNIEAAIQNIAGRTTDTSDRPFDDLSRIGDCKQLLPEVHLEAPLGDQIPLIDKLPKELFQETTLGPRLARYPNAPRFCFSEDTKVKLLSGISKTMKELSDDYKNGVENFVYSWDCNKNKWCVGKIVFAGVTKSVNKLAKVTLDDGSIIKCTPDHKFLLKSGVYKPVSEIDFNESLLSVYKKESKVVSYKIKSIEYIDYPNFVDVYDLTIENKEKTHNFALDVGVVVSNCHVDLASQSTSQAGYSLWHKEYIVNEMGEHQTVFVADFVSWISAPNRIDHDAIKQLSLDLRDKAGVYIKTISYDQFQCFTGDTKVSLLNGEEVSFKDILKRFNSGEELFTYTLDLETKKVVPGRIINAKNNGKKRIMKVVLDNDEEIRCTLDHRFMLRNGDFIQAQYLNSGDSLMPLYRKYSDKGYENVLNPLTNSWGLTYGKIANSLFGSTKGFHIHHKDFNKLNNNPNNLVLLTKDEHLKVHVEHFQELLRLDPTVWNRVVEKSQTEEARKKRSIKCKKIKEKFYADKNKSAYARKCQSESGKLVAKKYKQEMIDCTKKSFQKDGCKRAKEQSERIKILNKTRKPRLGSKTSDIALQNITKANLLKWESPEYVAKMKVRYPGARGHLIKLFGKNYKKTVSLETINKEKAKYREEWFKKHRINHKVKYIEFLDEYEDVYDISIDKAPNFALSAGVFVHNSEYVRQSLQQHHEFENVRYQSVDRDITAYLNFAQWMITGRIKVGNCPYLREQLGYIGVADKKLVTTHKKDMADSCLAYDTKIFLLSGKVLTIEELYHSDIEHEWILACDCETKQLKPVKIERVLEKHIPETLLQFTLSNGKFFACTDDHLILMKNGEYKHAEEILPYDELMPFNYYHELNYHDRYRKVVNPFRGTSKFLYKIVSQDLLSNAIAEAKKRAVVDGSKFTVIHHKSHNKNDDRPENLVPLTNIEHTNLHAMTGREIKAFHDRTVMKRARTKIINEGLALMKQVNPEGYRRYLLKHDLGDKLAEQKSKVENLHVYVTQITRIENTKPVYDIVLNSIHNFALDCNVFVHNCVGAVNNAYLDATPVEFPYIEAKAPEVKAEDSFQYDAKKQEVVEI